MIAGLVAAAVVVIVALLVAPGNDDNDDDNNNNGSKGGYYNDTGSKDTTTAAFDGSARAVLVLHNITAMMTTVQVAWYERVLADFFQARVVQVDRPFLRDFWRVAMETQKVVMVNDDATLPSLRGSNVSSLSTRLAIRIPFDSDKSKAAGLTSETVETILHDVLELDKIALLTNLVDTDIVSIQRYFQNVVDYSTYPPDAVPAFVEASSAPPSTLGNPVPTFTSTPPSTLSIDGPTASPMASSSSSSGHPYTIPPAMDPATTTTTAFPTDATPPPSPLPTPRPISTFSYFTTRNQLRQAVVAYQQDPLNVTSFVAQEYGYPIGTWYV